MFLSYFENCFCSFMYTKSETLAKLLENNSKYYQICKKCYKFISIKENYIITLKFVLRKCIHLNSDKNILKLI